MIQSPKVPIEKKKVPFLKLQTLEVNGTGKNSFKLKSALAKLVNPNTKSSEDSFKINLIVDSEKDGDEKIKEVGKRKKVQEAIYKDIVNGDVENLIFETLDLKTTKITSKLSSENKNIITTNLYEGGKIVYKIQEENQLKNLKNIDFTIYYLNQSAKSTFTKRMGIAPIVIMDIFSFIKMG